MCGDKENQQARPARQIKNQILSMPISALKNISLGQVERIENVKELIIMDKKLVKSFVCGGTVRNPMKRGAISTGIVRREGSNATTYAYIFNLDTGKFNLVSEEGDKRRKPSFAHPTVELLQASKPRDWIQNVVGGVEGNSRGKLYVVQCDTHQTIRYATDRSFGIKGARCTLEGRVLTETLRVDKHGKTAQPRKGWTETTMQTGVNKGKPAATVEMKGWCKQCHREAQKDYNDETGMGN